MANLQSSLQMLEKSGIDLSKNANPFGMLAMAQQLQQMGGAQRRTKGELMNVLRGETPPDQYMSYSDALDEMNNRYKTSPDSFENKELLEIQKYATMAGKDFDINFSGKRAAKRAGLNLLDMAAMGFISDKWIDEQAPALTSGEKIVGAVGSGLGFLAPYGVASKIVGVGAKGAAGLGNLAKGSTSGLSRATGKAGSIFGSKAGEAGRVAGKNIGQASQGVAKWLTATPKRISMVERALNLGSASAITSLYDEGVGGAIANGLGGMTLGAVGQGLAGMKFGTKALAGSIYAGLTAPDQEDTSEEHLEHVLKTLMLSGLFSKGGKMKPLKVDGKNVNINKALSRKTFQIIQGKIPIEQRRLLLSEGKGIALGAGVPRLNAVNPTMGANNQMNFLNLLR